VVVGVTIVVLAGYLSSDPYSVLQAPSAETEKRVTATRSVAQAKLSGDSPSSSASSLGPESARAPAGNHKARDLSALPELVKAKMTQMEKSVLLCETVSAAVRTTGVAQILAVLEKLTPEDKFSALRYAFLGYVQRGDFDTAKRLFRMMEDKSMRSESAFSMAYQYAARDLEGCLKWIETDLGQSKERQSALSGISAGLCATSDIRRLPEIFPLFDDEVERRNVIVHVVNGLPQLDEMEKLTAFVATLKGEELELANERLEWVKHKRFWSKFDKRAGRFHQR
jgi:pentatricopeptide repeat protein